MSLIFEQRSSDSPYLESVTHGWTVGEGSPIRPAETNWHMVFVKRSSNLYPLIVGPWTDAGVTSWSEGVELLWIRFKLGTFMPHLPTRRLLNTETLLPGGTAHSFWLHSSTWELPDFNNVETFVERLVRQDILVMDPVVKAALEGGAQGTASRTVRHRFLQATGLTQSHIRQSRRAQRAATLLEQGIPILDVVYEAGYFDQPHLTRSLKRFIGRTPAQIAELAQLQ